MIQFTGEGQIRPRSSARSRPVAAAAAGGVLAVLFALAAGQLAGRAAADAGARAATSTTALVAQAAVAPALDLAALTRTGTAAATDAGTGPALVLRQTVLRLRSTGAVDAVRVLGADGRVVWPAPTSSDAPPSRLPPRARDALQAGRVVLTGEPAAGGRFTGVAGIRDTAGTPALVEVTGRSPAPASWERFWPAAALAGAALLLVQLPLAAVLLGRRGRPGPRWRNAADPAQRAVEAADAERRRITAELHDSVIPDLTGLALQLDAVRLGAPGAPSARDAAAHAADAVRTTVGDLRRLLVGLVGTRLPGPDLQSALRELAGRLAASGTEVTVRIGAPESTARSAGLPRPTAELLYRAAQEVLRNVAAHSRAERVEISLECDDGEVRMIVDDDGCGFDEEGLGRRTAEGHLGLRAVGTAVAEQGGALTASSGPGLGTRVLVQLPLASAGAARTASR